MQILQICPPHLSDVATVPREIPKSHFQQYYSYNSSDNLCYLRRKQTVIHLPTPPDNVTAVTCDVQNFFI